MRIWHKSCTFRPGSAAIWPIAGFWLWIGTAWAAEALDLSRLVDPTRPATEPVTTVTAAPPTGEPVLQSTLISPPRRRAVISGRSYKPGDRVNGAVITDIEPYEVTLRRDGRETRLRLFPRLVKEPRPSSGKNPDKDG